MLGLSFWVALGLAKTSAEMRIPSVVLLCGVCDTAIETQMKKILEESTLRDTTKRKSLSTVSGVLLYCCVFVLVCGCVGVLCGVLCGVWLRCSAVMLLCGVCCVLCSCAVLVMLFLLCVCCVLFCCFVLVLLRCSVVGFVCVVCWSVVCVCVCVVCVCVFVCVWCAYVSV